MVLDWEKARQKRSPEGHRTCADVSNLSGVCITSASSVAAVAGFHLLLPTPEW